MCSLSMPFRWLPLFAVSVAAFFATQIIRADERSSSLSSLQERDSLIPGVLDGSTRIYFGLSAGYGAVSSSQMAEAPRGERYTLGGAISYRIPRWVFDLGVNWDLSFLSGINDQRQRVKIRTRAGSLELIPAYRVGERWQAGIVAALYYGTDTDFSDRVGDATVNGFGGFRLAYEKRFGNFPARIFFQGMTDLTISGRQASFGSVGVQIGIPVRIPAPDREVITVSQAAPLREEAIVRIILDPQKVFFQTDSARLKSEIERALESVGEYLGTEIDAVSAVKVEGHADQRGSRNYNLRLSAKRAESVRRALLAGGAVPNRISTEAHSFDRPADHRNIPPAWAKNRRVEIVFRDVKDPSLLREKLVPLMSATPDVE